MHRKKVQKSPAAQKFFRGVDCYQIPIEAIEANLKAVEKILDELHDLRDELISLKKHTEIIETSLGSGDQIAPHPSSNPAGKSVPEADINKNKGPRKSNISGELRNDGKKPDPDKQK